MAINGGTGKESGIGSVLAWQLSICEDGTPSMGMCRQHSDTSNLNSKKVNECYGAFGFFAGGPLWAGEKVGGEEQHKIGETSEGQDIFSGHLPTTSLFQMPDSYRSPGNFKGESELGDAPLNFEEVNVNWNAFVDTGFPRKTHLVYDKSQDHKHSAYGTKKGKWVFYTLVPSGGSSGGGKPPRVPPSDDDDDEEGDDEEEKEKITTETGKAKPKFVTTERSSEVTAEPEGGVQVTTEPQPVGGAHPDGDTGSALPKSGGGSVSTGKPKVYWNPVLDEWVDAGGNVVELDEDGNVINGGGTSGGGTYTSGEATPEPYYNIGPIFTEDEMKAAQKGGKGGGGGDGGGSAYLGTPFQHSFGDVKAKGTPTSGVGSPSGGASPNLKDYRSQLSQNSLNTWMNRAPITGIQTAFYGYTQDWRNPTYTQVPRSEGGDGKYKSGTADGGWFIRQPESEILDLREQNATGTDPTWIHTNRSNTVWGMLPSVKLFQGYPDMSTGGIKKGYSSYIDYSTNRVVHNVKEFGGAETNFMDYPGDSTEPLNVKVDLVVDQDIEWESGTGFKGALEHANSADRTYTFQNASGTVAFTSDIPSGAGLWTLATDVVKTTTNTHHVAFNDNVLNHGVTDTNTGFKINADVFSIETGGTVNATFGSDETLTVTNKIAWKDDTSFTGTLSHANSANRDYAFPDEGGQVKLKKDKVVFFPATGSQFNNVGDFPVFDATVSAGRPAFVTGICPDDFSSLTEFNVLIISSATDASVDIDFTSDYGASGEVYNNHSGSSTGTNYSLTINVLREISISSIVSSLAAQDYFGIQINNNDTVTVVKVVGIKMVYTPTN